MNGRRIGGLPTRTTTTSANLETAWAEPLAGRSATAPAAAVLRAPRRAGVALNALAPWLPVGSAGWDDVGLHEDSQLIIPTMPVATKHCDALPARCAYAGASQGVGPKRSARKSSMARSTSGICRRDAYTP